MQRSDWLRAPCRKISLLPPTTWTSPTSSVTNTSSYVPHASSRRVNLKLIEYTQVNIDDGFLNLMTPDGTAKDDVKLPEGDMGKQIQADFDEGKDLLVTIVSAMGEEQAISYKEAPK